MSKMIQGFNYGLKDYKLNEQIESFIYKNKIEDYTKLEIDSITSPVDTGETYNYAEGMDYAHVSSYPLFHVIVTFQETKMTEQEMDDLENELDKDYMLVIRPKPSNPKKYILKVKNKEFEFSKFFYMGPNNKFYYDGNTMIADDFMSELVKVIYENSGKVPELRSVYEWLENQVKYCNGTTLRIK